MSPYIKKELRGKFNTYINSLVRGVLLNNTDKSKHAGCINYIFTKFISEYINVHEYDYDMLNMLIGVLECIKQELYRRIMVDYEHDKCKENGDVYHEKIFRE